MSGFRAILASFLNLAKHIWNFDSVGRVICGVVPDSEVDRLVFLRSLRHEQIYQNDGLEQPCHR